MDSYVNLLSPLDNFNFTHFASPVVNNQPDSNNRYSSLVRQPPPSQQNSQNQKSNDELLALLEGTPNLDEYAYHLWDPASYAATPGTPWRQQLTRTYSDSPLSAASALSSLPSSQTCSPWETLPALAPSSTPDFLIPDSMASEFPSLLDFSATDEFSASAFDSLSLGSPAMMPQQLQNLEQPPSGSLDMSGFMLNHSLNMKASNMSLASSSSFSMGSMEQAAMPSMNDFHLQADLSNSTITPAMPQFRPPSPSTSDPGEAAHRFPDHRLFSSPSMPALNARFTRRKISRAVSYREFNFDGGESDDDYDAEGDGDYEYDDQDQDDSAAARGRKRARRTGMDGEFSDGSAASGSRMRSFSGRKASSARSKGPLDPKARRSKNKKRHPCTHLGCSASFTRITDMERHLTSVHRAADSTVNRCAFCQKQFSREDAVLRHENDSCPQRPKKKPAERWV